MRTAAIASILITAACGTQPEPTAPPPSAPPAPSIELEPWPQSTLAVKSTGAEPQAPLQVSLTGDDSQVTFESRFETTAKRGVTTTSSVVISHSRTLDISVGQTTSDGSPLAELHFTVSKAREVGSKTAPIDPHAASDLVGRSGRWRTSPHCQVSAAGIDDHPGLAERQLPSVLQGVVGLCPLLPQEAVGIGARWTVSEPRPDGSTLDTQWLLLQRDEDSVVLTFEAMHDTEGPRGTVHTQAEGRVQLDLSHPVPVRYDARGATTRLTQEPLSEGTTVPVTWTTEWTQSASRAQSNSTGTSAQ